MAKSSGLCPPFILSICCIKRRTNPLEANSEAKLNFDDSGNILIEEDQGYGTIKDGDDSCSVDDPEPTWNDLAEKYSSEPRDDTSVDSLSEEEGEPLSDEEGEHLSQQEEEPPSEEEEDPQYSKPIMGLPPKEINEGAIIEANRSQSAASSSSVPSQVQMVGVVGVKSKKLSKVAEKTPYDQERIRNTVSEKWREPTEVKAENVRKNGVAEINFKSEPVAESTSVPEQIVIDPPRNIESPEREIKTEKETERKVDRDPEQIEIVIDPPEKELSPPPRPRPSIATPTRDVIQKPPLDTRKKREAVIANSLSMSNEELNRHFRQPDININKSADKGVKTKSSKLGRLFGGSNSKLKASVSQTLVFSEGDEKIIPLNNLSSQSYQQTSASTHSLNSTKKKKKLRILKKFGRKNKKKDKENSIYGSIPSLSIASEPPTYHSATNKFSSRHMLASLDKLSDEDICRE